MGQGKLDKKERERLIDRIRKILPCGAEGTCPETLRESAVAQLAEQEGLHLPDHPERAMLAEITEAFILDRAAQAEAIVPGNDRPRSLDQCNVRRLLELHDMSVADQSIVTALTTEAEEWTRIQARQILAFTGSETPEPEQIKKAVLAGVEG